MELVATAFQSIESAAEAMTPLKFHALHSLEQQLATALALGDDKLRQMICLFAAFPFALFYRRLTTPGSKHLFDFAVGISLAQYLMGPAWIHSFLTTTVTYLLVRFGPSEIAPYLVLVFNMSYLSLAHLYRMHVDYMGYSYDFTTAQMVLVIKLTSFAFNFYDGVVDATLQHVSEENLDAVQRSRKLFALTECPSVLQFYGYAYCFSNCFVGPAFEMREYLSTTNRTKFLVNGELRKPSSTRPAMTKLIVGLIFLVLYIIYGGEFAPSILMDPEVHRESMWRRLLQAHMVLQVFTWKYYTAWKIAESCCVLCDFGFEGFDDQGNPRGWNGVSNIDIILFERGASFRALTRSWNKGTQAWLERYVYLRTSNSLLATYFVSAFWHGFYPGIYVFFLSAPIATAVDRLRFKRLRPYFAFEYTQSKLLHYLYETLSVVYSRALLAYLTLPYHQLSLHGSLAILRQFDFVGHVVMTALFLLLSLLPSPRARATKQVD